MNLFKFKNWIFADEDESSSDYSEEEDNYMDMLDSEVEEITESQSGTDDESGEEDEYDTAINYKEEMDALDKMQGKLVYDQVVDCSWNGY